MADSITTDIHGLAHAPEDVARWLVAAGLEGVGVDALLEGFCERLVADGVRLWRGHCSLSTVHPQVAGYGYTWRRGQGLVDAAAYSHGQSDSEAYQNSPFRHMLEEQVLTLRYRLTGRNARFDFPVLAEFRDEGATDWLGLCFSFDWRPRPEPDHVHLGIITSWISDAPRGFDDDEIRYLQASAPLLALAIKAAASSRMGEAILAAYLGRDVGRRVWSGEVHRGMAQTIRAILFLADLRGFTRLADSTPRADLVNMLDDYLECMAVPVQKRGGDILKFLGDGLLAIFELDGDDPGERCGTALDAAGEALVRVEALNRDRAAAGKPIMALDLALHLGDVLYGNVGSPERLEFTVIGPAVNEAARIEALCQELGTNLLISKVFADSAGSSAGRLGSLGRHRLRGVRGERELFTLTDGDAPAGAG